MPHVTPEQIRRLGTHALTRNGIPVPGANAMDPAACWNFSLTGTVVGGLDPTAPEQIYGGILDIDNSADPIVVNGLRPTATADNYPGCGAEIAALNGNIANAIAGDVAAGGACLVALVMIVARGNGLAPRLDGDDRYQLKVKATTWFGWDHWALSFRAEQPGRPRIYVQTVTGHALAHACDVIWDEHKLWEVTVNLQELHQAQVDFINLVNTFGDLCVECGAEHGGLPSNPFNAWHRCGACGAVYCPTHAQALALALWQAHGTRVCRQPGCVGPVHAVYAQTQNAYAQPEPMDVPMEDIPDLAYVPMDDT
jgi:hypothetical protein